MGVLSKIKKRGLEEATGVLDRIVMRVGIGSHGPTNQLEIRCFAMKRSGHHAVLEWIRDQIEGRIVFLNNCRGDSNPYLSCHRPSSYTSSWLGTHRRILWKNEEKGYHCKKNLLMYNYEDFGFIEILTENFNENREYWLGSSASKFDALIIRDPFNMMASRLRWAYGNPKFCERNFVAGAVDLWKLHAREYLGETNFLSNKVAINFNNWFLSEQYRLKIAKKLSITPKLLTNYRIARWGPTVGGESFDRTLFDGRAHEMKVLERWKVFRDDPFYRAIFQNREIVELSRQIFDHIPGTEELF